MPGRGRSARKPSVTLFILALAAFTVGTDVFVIAGIIPEISNSLRIPVSTAGYLVVAFSLAYGLCAPLAAVLTIRWSPRVVLACALSVLALGNVVCASSPDFLTAVLGRVLAGAGAASFTPQATAVAAEIAPPGHKGTALAAISTGLAAASCAGVPLGTAAATIVGWRITLDLVGALALLAAVGISILLRHSRPRGASHAAVGYVRQLADIRIAFITTTTFTAVLAEYLVYTYVAPVFAAVTGGNGRLLAALLLVFGVGGIAASAVTGLLIDRWNDRYVALMAFAVLAFNFAFLPWSSAAIGPSFIAMLIWGGAGWMYLAPQQHRLLALAGSDGSFAVSLNSSAIYLGAAAGAWIGGRLLQTVGLRWLGPVAAAISVLAGLLCLRPAHVEIGSGP